MREVVITGVGPVTAVGVGKKALWEALAAGRTHTTPRELQVDVAHTETLHIADVRPPEDLPELAPHGEVLEREECATHRDLAYAVLAAHLALADSGLAYERRDNRVGAIQVFEAPGMEIVVQRLFQMCLNQQAEAQPPSVYPTLAPHFYRSQAFLYVHVLGKVFGLHGFSTSVHNACSSGAVAIDVAAQQIRTGAAEAMIVCGGEAFETGVRPQWFRRLGLYSCDGRMRPFDSAASGFYCGEGGGAIILESAESADRRGATIYARYLGGVFAQQSWKHTLPDAAGGRLRGAIRRAMKQSGLSWDQVDLVVPHGTGTAISDAYEAEALDGAADSETGAVVTAFKPYVGHQLAASGITELICALMAARHGRIPPTPNVVSPITRLPLPLVTGRAREKKVRTLLKLSTGFTGHDGAALFRIE